MCPTWQVCGEHSHLGTRAVLDTATLHLKRMYTSNYDAMVTCANLPPLSMQTRVVIARSQTLRQIARTLIYRTFRTSHICIVIHVTRDLPRTSWGFTHLTLQTSLTRQGQARDMGLGAGPWQKVSNGALARSRSVIELSFA